MFRQNMSSAAKLKCVERIFNTVVRPPYPFQLHKWTLGADKLLSLSISCPPEDITPPRPDWTVDDVMDHLRRYLYDSPDVLLLIKKHLFIYESPRIYTRAQIMGKRSQPRINDALYPGFRALRLQCTEKLVDALCSVRFDDNRYYHEEEGQKQKRMPAPYGKSKKCHTDAECRQGFSCVDQRCRPRRVVVDLTGE